MYGEDYGKVLNCFPGELRPIPLAVNLPSHAFWGELIADACFTRLLECKARATWAYLGEQACPGLAIKIRAVWSAESCMAQWSCKLRTDFEIVRWNSRQKRNTIFDNFFLKFTTICRCYEVARGTIWLRTTYSIGNSLNTAADLMIIHFGNTELYVE